jgi:4-amino-4-deoxy-L-arabinose transferase-like glycosyltransferase
MTEPPPSPETTSPVSWRVLAACAAVLFLGIVDRDLWTPDEPRDAAVALAMSRTGDVVVPRLAGEPFVEKPPLYFASAALSARLLGPWIGETGAIRLTSALWGLGALFATFLLSRRLSDRSTAAVTVAALATMAGFVVDMHWIRVDAALAFFVAASLACSAEASVAGRAWFCLPAGLMAALAFLSKGVVGPLFIATGWLGLVLARRQVPPERRVPLQVLPPLAGLALFVLPCVAWGFLLKAKGGERVWDEWFWQNHVGRLTGTSVELGHMNSNPFYYLGTVALYTLPWLPAVLAWLWDVARRLRARTPLAPSEVFLLAWSAGSVLFLSVSATKRGLYLLPVLPAFAMMAARGSALPSGRLTRYFHRAWIGLCLVLLGASALSPGLVRLVPAAALRPPTVSYLSGFSLQHVLTLAAFLGAVAVLLLPRGRMPEVARLALVAALAWAGALGVPAQAVDRAKSMKDGVVAFVDHIPAERHPRIAGYRFSETCQAIFYYYGGWSVPLVRDRERLRAIVAGTDAEFDGVLITRTPALAEVLGGPYRVEETVSVGPAGHERVYQLVSPERRAGSK